MLQPAPPTADARATAIRMPAAYETALVALLGLVAGLVFIDRFGITFVFAQIQQDLRIDNSQLGALMAVTGLSWAVSSVGFSFLSDALGGRPKLIISGCLVGFSIATALVGMATSFMALILVRAVMGVFEGPVIPLIQAVIVRMSSPARVGANMGAVLACVSLMGGALSPIMMTALAEALGWRQAFLVLALPGFALAAALWLLMKPDAGGRGAARLPRPSLDDVRALFRLHNVRVALVGVPLLMGYATAFASFIPLYLTRETPISTGARLAMLVALGLVAAVGALLTPALSDRLSRKGCLVVATVFLAAAPAAIWASHASALYLAPALAAYLVGGGALTLMSFVIPGASVPPQLAGTTFALLVAVGEITGASCAPPLAGYAADHLGLGAALWVCCGLGAGAVLSVLALREPARAVTAAAA